MADAVRAKVAAGKRFGADACGVVAGEVGARDLMRVSWQDVKHIYKTLDISRATFYRYLAVAAAPEPLA